MKILLGRRNVEELFERIKDTIEKSAIWRNDFGKLKLKIPNAAPLVNKYCEQYFERDEDASELAFIYEDCGLVDEGEISRYTSEFIKLLVEYHKNGIPVIRIEIERK